MPLYRLWQPLQSNEITDAAADNRLGIWGGGCFRGATVQVGCIVSLHLSLLTSATGLNMADRPGVTMLISGH